MRPARTTAPQRRVAALLLLAGAYFAAAKLGLALAFVHSSATAVWPPTGIAFAAFLIGGRRVWPAIFLGAFVANLTTAGTVATSLGIAGGNTLEGLIGAWLVARFAGGRAAFSHPRHVFRFTLLAAAASTMVSATVGVTSLCLGGIADWARYGPVWLTWWLGDAAGDLLVAPVLVSWMAPPRPGWTRGRALEAVGLLVLVVLIGVLIFGGILVPAMHDPLAFLGIPPLLWSAFRFGPRETSAVTLLTSGIAVWGTLRGFGPFGRLAPQDSLLMLQAFMGILAVMALAVAATVSERLRAEQGLQRLNLELEERVAQRTAELSRSEARLLEAQALAHIGNWEWDIPGDRVWWSEELYRIYGLEPATFRASYEAFLGRVHSEDRPRVQETLERAYQDHQPFGFEHRIVRPDGTIRNVYGRGCVLLGPAGQPTRMDGTAQDVSDLKRVEQELQRRAQELVRSNAELERFAYVASHDLQEPLRMVSSFTRLLARRYEGRLDAKADQYIAFAVDGAERMRGMIEGILQLSRVGRGAPFAPVDCEGVLSRTLANLGTLVAESGARVTHGPLPTVFGDTVQIGQLFQNLLGNALKFRGAAPPEVDVQAVRNGTRWRFSIADNGIGIAAEHLGRIFEMLQRLHTREEYPGTGMGLAIAQRIVERHGGRIWAESEPGRGATFHFTLPAAASPPEG